MGCDDRGAPAEAEAAGAEEYRQGEIRKVTRALRRWIEEGAGTEFRVRRSYDSQYATDPTYSVSTDAPVLSCRIPRR